MVKQARRSVILDVSDNLEQYNLCISGQLSVISDAEYYVGMSNTYSQKFQMLVSAVNLSFFLQKFRRNGRHLQALRTTQPP